MTSRTTLGALLAAGWIAGAVGTAWPETPLDIERALEAEARQTAPGFSGFSPERGRQLFTATHGRDWSCATCHTPDPRRQGLHATTGKTIAPLAPSANAERFTSRAKVDKWFKRNCNDVLGRPCTPVEAGDVLAWLNSLGQ
jgi:mono/diheme cytochrome c family protein